jgi:serine/threonine-protein kinase
MSSEALEIEWNKYIGRKLSDNFTLVYKLGQGAMGAVFVGYQHTLKRQVAIKVIPKVNASGYRHDLFRNEAEVVAVLSHPNIVPIYEMGETDDLYYQVMQLVQGRDLRSALRERRLNPVPSNRLFPLDESITMLIQVLDALGYAHQEGVVHQDIKPANLLIEDRSKRVLIADFGIARATEAEYKAQGRIVGTPQYMSPEQAQCAVTDGRADIYSVGIILFEMVTANHPFKNESSDTVLIRKRLEPQTCDSLMADTLNSHEGVPAAIRGIILHAAAADAVKRYQQCDAFKEELESALNAIRSRTAA